MELGRAGRLGRPDACIAFQQAPTGRAGGGCLIASPCGPSAFGRLCRRRPLEYSWKIRRKGQTNTAGSVVIQPLVSIANSHSWRVLRIRSGEVTPASRSTSKIGHGNEKVWKVWKAWKATMPPFPHSLEIPQDFHIPTASTTTYICLLVPLKLEALLPQGCNGCLRSTA
jgi:hypothetical protein